jgi:hypothetical protein
MTEVILAAWIGGGCTILAATIAFGTLAYQGGQSRAADRLARKQAFNEKLYGDGVAAARTLSSAAGAYMTRLYVAQQQVEIAAHARPERGEAWPPTIRFVEFFALRDAFEDALTDLIFLIEERLIADQRLEIFKLAFAAKAHEVREAFNAELQWTLMRALPHQFPDGRLAPYEPVSPETLERLKSGIDQLAAPLLDCSAFCEDLIVELQNTHLGEVFESRLSHRVPQDPSKLVIKLDDHVKIRQWIRSTPWDLNNRRIEAAVQANLQRPSSGESGE